MNKCKNCNKKIREGNMLKCPNCNSVVCSDCGEKLQKICPYCFNNLEYFG